MKVLLTQWSVHRRHRSTLLLFYTADKISPCQAIISTLVLLLVTRPSNSRTNLDNLPQDLSEFQCQSISFLLQQAMALLCTFQPDLHLTQGPSKANTYQFMVNTYESDFSPKIQLTFWKGRHWVDLSQTWSLQLKISQAQQLSTSSGGSVKDLQTTPPCPAPLSRGLFNYVDVISRPPLSVKILN